MEQILQNQKISREEALTEEGKAKKLAAIAGHLEAIKRVMGDAPESVLSFTFCISTREKFTCGLFGSTADMSECIEEIINKFLVL